jgi:hypothetical protein
MPDWMHTWYKGTSTGRLEGLYLTFTYIGISQKALRHSPYDWTSIPFVAETLPHRAPTIISLKSSNNNTLRHRFNTLLLHDLCHHQSANEAPERHDWILFIYTPVLALFTIVPYPRWKPEIELRWTGE